MPQQISVGAKHKGEYTERDNVPFSGSEPLAICIEHRPDDLTISLVREDLSVEHGLGVCLIGEEANQLTQEVVDTHKKEVVVAGGKIICTFYKLLFI